MLIGFLNSKDAARIVLDQTSVDMSMVALDLRFYTDVVELVREGTIPESRIDESALRILQLKVGPSFFYLFSTVR